MAEEGKPRLGRGLAALLGESAAEVMTKASEDSQASRKLPIEQLRSNGRNPRKSFSEQGLDELAQSIRDRGILQPILVRSVADGYEIVAGERRWRAAQRAGMHEVPVIRVEATDRQALEIAIIENVQRTDLNVLEEAEGYQRLIDEFDYSHHDLSKVIGKSRSHVTNTIRLLKLPQETRSRLAKGEISAGHARALLSLDDPDRVVERIVRDGLTVRDVEAMASASAKQTAKNEKSAPRKDPQVAHVEKTLSDALGMSVVLSSKGDAGELRIRYKDLDQLDLLCRRLQS